MVFVARSVAHSACRVVWAARCARDVLALDARTNYSGSPGILKSCAYGDLTGVIKCRGTGQRYQPIAVPDSGINRSWDRTPVPPDRIAHGRPGSVPGEIVRAGGVGADDRGASTG